jgi:hydrogenase nickel incorporation protein HypA/HybF
VHESTLARRLLEVVLTRAAEAGAARVGVVRGWLAETEALSAEALALHFGALAAGTVAEGARLEIAARHVEARCGACACVYRPDHVLLCPECGSTEGTLLGETGLGIESLEIEDSVPRASAFSAIAAAQATAGDIEAALATARQIEDAFERASAYVAIAAALP